jgi:hypothetical protein
MHADSAHDSIAECFLLHMACGAVQQLLCPAFPAGMSMSTVAVSPPDKNQSVCLPIWFGTLLFRLKGWVPLLLLLLASCTAAPLQAPLPSFVKLLRLRPLRYLLGSGLHSTLKNTINRPTNTSRPYQPSERGQAGSSCALYRTISARCWHESLRLSH